MPCAVASCALGCEWPDGSVCAARFPGTGLGLAQRRQRSLCHTLPRATSRAGSAASLAARDMDGSVHAARYRAPGSASRNADGVVCGRESPSTGLGLAQRRRRSLRARIPELRLVRSDASHGTGGGARAVRRRVPA